MRDQLPKGLEITRSNNEFITSKMADRAPGYEQAAEDHECYNCGMKGHMFLACPEETRRVPAGLEASRKRQATGNEYHVPAKRTKGPVVTHYPPPPSLSLSHISPPPMFSPGPGYEGLHPVPPPSLPARPPYHHQPPPLGHYDQYPPLNIGPSPSRSSRHSNSRDVYEHHFQGAPRTSPPGTPYRPPHYDQYDQHRSGPPPSTSYGRSYSAPDRYDERSAGLHQNSSYAAAYRAPYQTNLESYPPAPGVDNYYPGPPQPYPPPHLNVYRASPQYGYDGPSAARPFTSGHEPPPPGTYPYQSPQYPHSDPPQYHARYDERFDDRPSYEPQRMDTYSGRRSGENRQNREHHGRRMRFNSPKGRSRSERRFLDRPARLPSPKKSTPPAQPGTNPTISESSKPQQGSSNTVPANISSTEKYTAEDFAWEEEMIFKELPLKITRDLIREPLPIDWTDDPIMPPKYDKETITSKYINSTNVDDFALSVRETKAWQIVQHHPAFLPPTDVRIEKLLDYERALDPGGPGLMYSKQNRHNVNNSGGRQRGKSWGPRARGGRHIRHTQHYGQNHLSTDDQVNHSRPEWARKNRDPTSHRDAEKHERESEDLGRELKTSSPEPGEVCETDDQGPTSTTKSSTPSWDREYHAISRNQQDRIVNSLQGSRAGLLDLVSESDARIQGPLTPSLPPTHLSGPPSRLSSGHISPQGLSRPSSRHSLRSDPSPQSSRRSSVGSPLTPTELELLGMRPYSSDSDAGQDSPTPQPNGSTNRSRQRPAKLHAAYQRRW
ncbi:hypothetical protein F4860DRAFT_94810 [Xylaria cubensis]|nr:hypothetical protein F4860DRAFT_94810 [Xylaria cubensis]